MKIGILTFHRAHNYGAVLQCFAMQETIKSMGHEVYVINYHQPYVEKEYKILNWKYICFFLKRLQARGLIRYLLSTFERINRSKNFMEFRKYFSLTVDCDETHIPSDFDIYIMGSDQIWNIYQTGNIVDKPYFGDFPVKQGAKKIAYAISMSEKGINMIDSAYLKKLLKGFHAISFRESSISEHVSRLIDIKCETCLDPTLLNSSTIWDPIINDKWKNKKYILTYFITPVPNAKKRAEELAKTLGFDIIHLYPMRYSVEDFVSLFKYAQFVIGTSFHGTAFSLIFHRPMYSIISNHVGDIRYINLLTKVGADCYLQNEDFPFMFPEEVDWNNVDEKLSELRKDSYNYLRQNLS